MVVGWHCKKQTAVALSTAEAEYVAASIGGKALLGLKELAGELGLQVTLLMCMNLDNQAAIKQVENEASSSKAKHEDVRLKFIGDYYRKVAIQPTYVTTHDMLADILTKPIPAPKIQALRADVGLE
uniref:Putative pol protein n=1 Tax=Albugo laibachii Nc14 TaxID=890382 RepID=F0X177_9STRA|nr:putative pol protein [Albugo laibachii Nc14]|eukprot:CCA27535.1 putative pol protein [Albugo laibachii Nc14]